MEIEKKRIFEELPGIVGYDGFFTSEFVMILCVERKAVAEYFIETFCLLVIIVFKYKSE